MSFYSNNFIFNTKIYYPFFFSLILGSFITWFFYSFLNICLYPELILKVIFVSCTILFHIFYKLISVKYFIFSLILFCLPFTLINDVGPDSQTDHLPIVYSISNCYLITVENNQFNNFLSSLDVNKGVLQPINDKYYMNVVFHFFYYLGAFLSGVYENVTSILIVKIIIHIFSIHLLFETLLIRKMNTIRSFFVSIIIGGSPVVISQLSSFYLDSLSYSLFLISLCYLSQSRIYLSIIAIVLCLMAKTSAFYAVFIYLFLLAWKNKDLFITRNLTAIFKISAFGILSFLFFFSFNINNFSKFFDINKHQFVTGKLYGEDIKLRDLNWNAPENPASKEYNNIQKFLISKFMPPSQEVRKEFDIRRIGNIESYKHYRINNPDTRYGTNGILFSWLIGFSIIYSLINAKRKTFVFLTIGIFILAVQILPQTWYERVFYVTFLLVALPLILYPNGRFKNFLLGVFALNFILIFSNYMYGMYYMNKIRNFKTEIVQNYNLPAETTNFYYPLIRIGKALPKYEDCKKHYYFIRSEVRFCGDKLPKEVIRKLDKKKRLLIQKVGMGF